MVYPTAAQVIKDFTEVVTACSLLHLSAPPVSALDEFPRLQKGYKLFIFVLEFFAAAGRNKNNDRIATNPTFQQGYQTTNFQVIDGVNSASTVTAVKTVTADAGTTAVTTIPTNSVGTKGAS